MQLQDNTDETVGRAEIAKSTSDFNRLNALYERARVAAAQIRTMDQTMETVGTTVNAMKQELEVMTKEYPPYPPGNEERVRRLRAYAGLRAMIDRLTDPPVIKVQDAHPKGNDDSLPDNYTTVVGPDGKAKTVSKEDLRIGPSGIYIPQLSPSDVQNDETIQRAIGQLNHASDVIQAQREALRAQASAVGGSGAEPRMSEQGAEQASVRLGRDLAGQPVGIAHESTAQMDQLLG